MDGKSVFGKSKTGTGKTAAFVLPIISLLSKDPYGIFALVLTPTRELANQIANTFRLFGQKIGLTFTIISGGNNKIEEIENLDKNPHILVATPGRLADHIDSKIKIKLNYLKFLVLDEADRLFDKSFDQSLNTIFKALPSCKKRQTLLYSATKNKKIEYILSNYPSKITSVEAKIEKNILSIVESLSNFYLIVPRAIKEAYLYYLLTQFFTDKTIIIFVSKKNVCELLSETLKILKLNVCSLHSNLKQKIRLKSLKDFRKGEIKVLICTDLASRGLDIPLIDIVINFNVPLSTDDYIHRIGRTARANKRGMAITLVSQYEINAFKHIEQKINKKINLFPGIKNENSVLQKLNKVSNAKKISKIRLERNLNYY